MAKKKKLDLESEETLEITSAAIKDDFCNYSFEIIKGLGSGDKHSVKGKGIIDDDLREAFFHLNVHLACVDDVFKHANVNVDNINDLRGHELATAYSVVGVRIRGGSDDLSVILLGDKYISKVSGRMSIETPKIPLDENSSYPFYSELRKVVKGIREEVKLYKEGKYTAVSAIELDPNQLEIDPDFDEAKV